MNFFSLTNKVKHQIEAEERQRWVQALAKFEDRMREKGMPSDYLEGIRDCMIKIDKDDKGDMPPFNVE